MTLAANIKQHYLTHADQLSTYYKFHFGSRLWSWSGDVEGRILLDNIAADFTQGGNPEKLMVSLASKLEHLPTPHINGAELREQYFAKYPELRHYNALLFQMRHLTCAYGIDLRDQLETLIPLKELLSLRNRLLADRKALAVLSTYAINYLYLVQRFILKDDANLDVSAFYSLKDHYKLDNPQQLQLFIYLYTHCIIAETIFYVRALPEINKPLYQQMITDLETVITARYDYIHLDNKFEFLVCAEICGMESPTLRQRIHDEAERSVSNEGTFLIDRHNKNHQTTKTELVSSEHRNVLYIMSTQPFRPHQIE
jgi:hypothetical protein